MPVSGEANFDMERTALTVGGFTQPVVARGVIELQASIEKGLTQRFLWLCRNPSFGKMESLELIDESFVSYLGEFNATLLPNVYITGCHYILHM